MGLLAAGIGLPILLTFYFLKLRRRPVRVSSTLLWDQAARDLEVNAPLRMIRPSLLLLLHLLALALLCLAIARPTLDTPRDAPGSIVLLIDRSASMSARDAGDASAPITRLDSSKQMARDLLGRLDDRVQVSVIAFAAEPSIVSPMSPDLAQAIRAIEAVEPTDQPGDLHRALRLVEAMTAGQASETGEPIDTARVVILSDGEPVSRTDDPRPFALDPGRIEFLPAIEPGATPRANIAVVSADAARDADDLALVRLFARVLAVNPASRELTLTLRLNGRPVASRPLSLSESAGDPGVWEGSITFEFNDDAEGGLAVVSHAVDDALESDNAYALRLNPPLGPRVLLVQAAAPENAIDYVLADALAVPSLRVQTLETITITQYERRLPQNSRPGELVRVRLESGDVPDLVIFDACTPSRLPACPSVSFGAPIPLPGLNLAPPENTPTRVAFFRRTHPLLRYADLGDLRIERHRRLTLPEPGSAVSRVRILAESAEGPLIAELVSRGVTRVIVGFALSDASWWRRPGFPRFIKNTLDTLTETGVENTAASATTTDAVPLTPAQGAAVVRISGPVERTVSVGGDSAPLGVVLPRAGVYDVDSADPAQLPINLASPEESRIRTGDALDISNTRISGGGASSIVPREIWHWFVLADAQQTAEQSTEQAVELEAEESKFRLTFSADELIAFETDLDDTAGDVSSASTRLRLQLDGDVSDDFSTSLAFTGTFVDYEFSGVTDPFLASPEAIDDAYELGVRLIGRHTFDETWSAVGGGFTRAGFADNADIDDAFTYGGFIAAGYRSSDVFSIDFGVLVSTRLEDDLFVIPYVGIRWQIDETLTLSSNGLGGRLDAKLDDSWTVYIHGRYESHEYRLDDDFAPAPGGVIRDDSYPVGVGVRFAPSRDFSITLEGGIIFGREFEFFDDSENDLRTIETSGAVSTPQRSNARLDRRSFLTGAASLAALASVPAPARARATPRPTKPAKNLIFAVADGCGPGAITVGEHYSQLRDGRSLNWTGLFNDPDATTSIVSTECADGYVTDSAASASAWAIGETCNYRAVSWTPDHRAPRPLFLRARDAGKAIGMISNTYLWDATPVAWVANGPDRKTARYELAEQLVESGCDVALGGGQETFKPDILALDPSMRVVRTRDELGRFARTPDRLLGLFARENFPYRFEYDGDTPELAGMLDVALGRLRSASPDGFTLLIEGAKVDHAAHANDGASLCNELAHFDETLGTLIDFAKRDGETLLVVTTDHANANPALTEYAGGGAKLFRNILKPTHSFEWLIGQANLEMGVRRRADVLFESFRQSTGYPLTNDDFAQIERFFADQSIDGYGTNSKLHCLMGAICANHTGLAFLSPNHTSDPVTATALGPGHELFDPWMHISEIHHKLVAALDLPPLA
ncbi:phoA [Symbiodinium necroappetens]|uniref:alkaline phosphatase n=1 Tax=Symbiodinium necroappetens TaxID=1628268 RepID=A0A812ITC7_9DINO|nr:phoA [Symbiodinium necroappetens]